LENLINMNKEEVLKILKNYKNSTNGDLEKVMDFLNEDFEKTKDVLIKLSEHLDITKDSYDKIYIEYKKRTNGSV